MTELKQEENQKEFFEEFSGETKRAERFPSIAKTQKPILISASAEHLVFAGILAVLVSCFMFFLGVMRGRNLVDQPVLSTTFKSNVKPSLTASPPAAPAAFAAAKQPTVEAPLKSNLAKPYTIVLVTYKKQSLAEKEVAALKKRGQPAFISTSSDYFLVSTGQYANISDAKKDLIFFNSKYKGCFLKRR